MAATPALLDGKTLGIVAYHCLTGTSPFRRESHIATALAHLNDELPEAGQGLPADVMTLIRSLTAKNPSERPANAAAVALEAAQIGAAGAIELPETFELPAGDPAGRGPTQTASALTSPIAIAPVRRRRGPTAVYAGVGAAALVIGFLGWQTMGSDDPAVVPDVIGLSAADAKTLIRDADMTARTETIDAAGAPAGQVVKQSPEAGTSDTADKVVAIIVASGKVAISADRFIGQTYAKASAALEKLGLVVKREDVTRNGDAGEVVSLDKSGRLPDGATVTLSVAVAPVAATAPSADASSPSTGSSGNSNGTGNSTKGKPKGKGEGKSKGLGNK